LITTLNITNKKEKEMSSNTYEQIASELKLDFKHFLELYLNQSTSLEELDIIAKEMKDKWNIKENR